MSRTSGSVMSSTYSSGISRASSALATLDAASLPSVEPVSTWLLLLWQDASPAQKGQRAVLKLIEEASKR